MDTMDRLEGLLIRDLRALVTLAERQHFAQAAEEFGISQPSLSAIVKKIEGVFGVPLFVRTTRRFAITPEGEAVVRETRAVLQELNRLATVLDTDKTPLTGRLRLGIIPTLGPYYVPHFLQALCAAYPALELVLLEGKTDNLINQLRLRDLDAALLSLPIAPPDLTTIPLFRESFMLAVPEDHPLSNREQITVDDVDTRELLILEQGNCLQDQTLDACGVNRPGAVKAIHATSLETLRYMVATRIGIAIMPRLAVPSPEEGSGTLPIRYLEFAAPEPARIVGLATRHQDVGKQDFSFLVEFLRTHLPDTVTPA